MLFSKGLNSQNNDGWLLSDEFVFKCPNCKELFYPAAMNDSGSCSCGNLSLDQDYGRFGAKTGDKSIEVYKTVK